MLKFSHRFNNLKTRHSVKIFYTISKRNATSQKKSKKYSHTICLPVTEFPLYVNSVNRVQLDQEIEKNSNFDSLYKWQRSNVNGSEYILHDGPPYANGPAHIGHALNKILKDITVRQHLLNGRKIHFKPGWDCHGLPIELKALSKCKIDWRNMSASELRSKARTFALESMEEQKATFKKWGILADWESECYYTYDKNYVQNQIKQFYNLYKKNLIYRDLKPVYWSPSTRTALAEAELEYSHDHVSKAVTVRAKLDLTMSEIKIPDDSNLFALIWTTTPWTLPANKAIAFSNNLNYSFVKINENPLDLYLMATDLIPAFGKLIEKPVTAVSTFPGSSLTGLKYEHFYYKNQCCPFIKGTHVNSNKGTGLVHIAPAHGTEDFVLGLQYKLSTKCIIDENGCYTSDAGELKGVNVIDSGSDRVIDLLHDDVLHIELFKHSYPYDWRTKLPVIIRASEQWFMNCESLKETAVKCLENVTILPERYSRRLESLLKIRPFWCISRQRLWGVPLPVLYDTRSNQPIINEKLINRYCDLIDRHGTDFWWNLSIRQLLPEDIEFSNVEHISKSEDILDIWFDSGISWFNALDGNKVADMYMEGIDQCTGWFQSSLLTSVAARNIAPFKNIFIHGFAVDENNRKMSKSLGNVIEPQDVICGKDKKPAYGIDVLRWWVANHTVQHSHIPVTENTFGDSKKCVQKVRAVTRFLLGNLHQYNSQKSSKSYWILDKYMLFQILRFHSQIQFLYEHMDFNRVTLLVINFVSNQVSAIYAYLVKDRLYCDLPSSDRRLAAQEICFFTLSVILRSVAPMMPHFVEEVCLHYPIYSNEKSYFRNTPFNPPANWDDENSVRIVKKLFEIKEVIMNSKLNNIKLQQFSATVHVSESIHEMIQNCSEAEILEILQISSIKLVKDLNKIEFRVVVEETKNTLCERCRKYTCNGENEELCSRCAGVIN